MSEIRVSRYAPSPTTLPDENGNYRGLTLGGARTCLFAWLLARSGAEGSKFVIRSENTDVLRSTEASETAVLESLRWIGIESDIPIVRQSDRGAIYQEYIDRLLREEKAYKCYCTQEILEEKREAQKARNEKAIYDRTCLTAEPQDKPFVVRFKVPEGTTEWEDSVLGPISINNKEISDPILQRSDGSFCFIFVNMLDDALQGVTHVLRGQDGVANCGTQRLLNLALGFTPPTYAHVPLVLSHIDRSKLSKRSGSKSMLELRDDGYLPQAVVNCLARIGCSFGDKGEVEILSVDEMIKLFKVENLNKAPAIFDPSKLLSINAHYIKNSDTFSIALAADPFFKKAGLEIDEPEAQSLSDIENSKYYQVVKSLQPRAKTLVEMAEMARFYYQQPTLNKYNPWSDTELTALVLLKQKLQEISFTPETIEAAVKEVCAQLGIKLKQVGNAFRFALTGSEQAPSIYEIIHILGKEEVDKRLTAAINLGAS